MCSLAEKKDYLNSYQELILDFNRELEDARYWHSLAYNVGAFRMDESGVTNTSMSIKNQPVDKYLELEERCIERSELIDQRKSNILKAIKEINKCTYRTVLSLHYIDGYSLHSVAKKMFMEQHYIYRLHKNALKAFEIPKEDRKRYI